MSMYKEVSTNLNFVEREQETEKFWEENHIFEKSMEEREGHPEYVFYDGLPPPTASLISATCRPAPLRTCSPGSTQ